MVLPVISFRKDKCPCPLTNKVPVGFITLSIKPAKPNPEIWLVYLVILKALPPLRSLTGISGGRISPRNGMCWAGL